MSWHRQAATAAFILLLAVTSFTAGQEGDAPASITVIVPADAELLFDGVLTAQTGSERTFTTPDLAKGKKFHYNLVARWQEGGKPVEKKKRVDVSAGANIRVAFVDEPKVKGKDIQTVTSKPTKRVPASTINFKKAFGLPFDSLGTLGSRIDSARRKPDPVALAHTASELSIAEKVSKKQASLTSTALLAESAQLAQLRRQVAELKAVYAVHQQIANEETSAAGWTQMIESADRATQQESAAIRSNTLPTDTPRRVLVNNYTTQYIDVWVNGTYKMQVPPGGSSWCTIEHKWNPTILTGYGNEDDGFTYGPMRIFGAFKTYTWNIQGG
jgi:uncharacterized protein (TIGR03000 family)